MNVDYTHLSTQTVPISNCTPSDQEGTIVTLNPEMVIPDELQGRDFAFPFLHESFRILQEEPKFDARASNAPHPYEQEIAEGKRAVRLPPGVAHDWHFTKPVWSLFLKGRHDVCSDYIKREHKKYRFTELPHPFEVIYAFCARLGRRRAKEVFDQLHEEWERARTVSPKHRDALREYFLETHMVDFLYGTWTVISEYMEHFSEFSQVLIYQDRDVSIGEGLNPSSSAFDNTKMFYGNAFEHFAAFLVLPACLNNVVESRPYDTFLKLTLDEYLSLDKGRRQDSLKNNRNLSKLTDALHNQVRNASHHRNMRFDPNTCEIAYLATKKGTWKRMKYSEYLILCNKIMQTIAGLTCFLIAELQPNEPKTSK